MKKKIPSFTLGGIYSSNASGAEQMLETKKKYNEFKNLNWP